MKLCQTVTDDRQLFHALHLRYPSQLFLLHFTGKHERVIFTGEDRQGRLPQSVDRQPVSWERGLHTHVV